MNCLRQTLPCNSLTSPAPICKPAHVPADVAVVVCTNVQCGSVLFLGQNTASKKFTNTSLSCLHTFHHQHKFCKIIGIKARSGQAHLVGQVRTEGRFCRRTAWKACCQTRPPAQPSPCWNTGFPSSLTADPRIYCKFVG